MSGGTFLLVCIVLYCLIRSAVKSGVRAALWEQQEEQSQSESPEVSSD